MSRSLAYRTSAASAVLISLLGLSACGHKAVKSDDTYAAVTDAKSTTPGTGEAQSSDAGNAHGLETVHFGYDSNTLSAEAKTVLKANASILKSNPSLHVQIEGHCDQRGGIQYNIALGERRAMSAKHFLEDHGVEAARITTISYGKERPIDSAENEEAYAKNRRANFVITSTMAER